MKRLIHSPDPISVTDLGWRRRQGAEYRLYFRRDAQSEQDSLQEKGMCGAGLPGAGLPEESGGFMNIPG